MGRLIPLAGLPEAERAQALRDLARAARALDTGDRAEARRCLDRAHCRVEPVSGTSV